MLINWIQTETGNVKNGDFGNLSLFAKDRDRTITKVSIEKIISERQLNTIRNEISSTYWHISARSTINASGKHRRWSYMIVDSSRNRLVSLLCQWCILTFKYTLNTIQGQIMRRRVWCHNIVKGRKCSTS